MLLSRISSGKKEIPEKNSPNRFKKKTKNIICLPGQPHHLLLEGPPTRLLPSNREGGGGAKEWTNKDLHDETDIKSTGSIRVI